MKDAWLQHHELLEKFSTRVDVRADIRVTALACDRAVRLTLIHENPDADRHGPKGLKHYHDTGPRNVSTMRELAKAILEACDFVDESNPKWAADTEAYHVGSHEIVWKEKT